jgi:hypothetical protein
MMVNAAVFTCSICGEVSANICAYCTKDACSNHRCERCKRCSDCCECDVPLSAEERVAPEDESPAVESLAAPTVESLAAEAGSSVADFLTPEESSVFSGPFVSPEAIDLHQPVDPEHSEPNE